MGGFGLGTEDESRGKESTPGPWVCLTYLASEHSCCSEQLVVYDRQLYTTGNMTMTPLPQADTAASASRFIDLAVEVLRVQLPPAWSVVLDSGPARWLRGLPRMRMLGCSLPGRFTHRIFVVRDD